MGKFLYKAYWYHNKNILITYYRRGGRKPCKYILSRSQHVLYVHRCIKHAHDLCDWLIVGLFPQTLSTIMQKIWMCLDYQDGHTATAVEPVWKLQCMLVASVLVIVIINLIIHMHLAITLGLKRLHKCRSCSELGGYLDTLVWYIVSYILCSCYYSTQWRYNLIQ